MATIKKAEATKAEYLPLGIFVISGQVIPHGTDQNIAVPVRLAKTGPALHVRFLLGGAKFQLDGVTVRANVLVTTQDTEEDGLTPMERLTLGTKVTVRGTLKRSINGEYESYTMGPVIGFDTL